MKFPNSVVMFRVPRKAWSFTLCPALSFHFLSKLSCLCLSSGFCACGRVSLFCSPPLLPCTARRPACIQASDRSVTSTPPTRSQQSTWLDTHQHQFAITRGRKKSWQAYCFYLKQEAEFQILRWSVRKPKLSILIRRVFLQSQRWSRQNRH